MMVRGLDLEAIVSLANLVCTDVTGKLVMRKNVATTAAAKAYMQRNGLFCNYERARVAPERRSTVRRAAYRLRKRSTRRRPRVVC